MSRKKHKSGSQKGARDLQLNPRQMARLQQAVNAQTMGNYAAAEADYKVLIADQVRVPQVYGNLAQILAQTGRRSEADELWKKALAVDSTFIDAHMNLADSMQLAGDLDGAASTYRRVIAQNKGFVAARYMLGNVLKAQGKLDKAAACYQEVIKQEPAYTQAHFTYSAIHKYADSSDAHLHAMKTLYETPGLGAENKMHLDFALAKAHEDIGEYSEAYRHLESGNNRRATEFEYDIESDRELIDSIIETFSAQAMSAVSVNADLSRRPIFIVGMPRSGTSLVEKILASHSEVYGAGELDYMFALGTSQFLRRDENYKYRPLAAYPDSLFRDAGKAYLEQIEKLNNSASRVTDKMPFNMMMVGIIRLALPNATIVHCVRDARDTCLSIYKQNFTTGNYRFAYNQKTVAQFYKLYERLMAHWHEAMPGAIYDVNYESLTREPEAQIRQLLEACDLEFQQQCVDFQKTRGVVKTASAYQVRQPMYTTSVGLWQRYQEFLAPMLAELGTR